MLNYGEMKMEAPKYRFQIGSCNILKSDQQYLSRHYQCTDAWVISHKHPYVKFHFEGK